MKDDQHTIRIGISACLLGQEVRFDGGHKRDRYLTDTLGEYFEWVPVCPEVEIGLGTPRETIHLVKLGDETRLVTTKTDIDLTDKMQSYAEHRVNALAKENLSGYILKKDSPSCGMERVKIHPDRAIHPKGMSSKVGKGLFAEVLLKRFPNLPIEEEGRLCDPRLRENWIERVFAYHQLTSLWAARWTIGQLVAFHTRYKFLLMAHSEKEYRELGKLVGNAKQITRQLSRSELKEQYSNLFMSAMKKMSTIKKQINVLQHMMGFFKQELDTSAKQELLDHIEDYRRGFVPLIVPVTLIRHYVRLLNVEYLQDQVYLNPHPKELALRNHV